MSWGVTRARGGGRGDAHMHAGSGGRGMVMEEHGEEDVCGQMDVKLGKGERGGGHTRVWL